MCHLLGCRLYPELLWLAVLVPALVPVTVGRFSRLGKAKGRDTGVIPPSIPKFSGRFGAMGPKRLAVDDGTYSNQKPEQLQISPSLCY